MADVVTVLVVDDSPATVEVLTRNLEGHGLEVVAAHDADGARRLLRDAAVDLVVTDLKMPGESGLDLVRHVRAEHPQVGVVMITGYPSIETAVEAVKSGAEEYLAKPFTDAELLTVVDRVLAGLVQRGTAAGGGRVEQRFGLVTAAPEMAPALQAIDRAATTIDPVLVIGPVGSGRTTAARAIHRGSARAERPFVTVSCRDADPDWLARQLLGGAGAGRASGLAMAADGGSLVLQEVEWLAPELQVDVLRLLNERALRAGSGGQPRTVDVRWIATAATELSPECRGDGFRRDLALRLGAVVVRLPPLARRTGDVPVVAARLLARRCELLGRPPVVLAEAAVRRLTTAPWMGEIAGLAAVLAAALERTAGERIELEHLPGTLGAEGVVDGPPASLASVEAAHIRRVLARVDGNKTEAARILGIDRKTLRDRLRRSVGAGAGSVSGHGGE